MAALSGFRADHALAEINTNAEPTFATVVKSARVCVAARGVICIDATINAVSIFTEATADTRIRWTLHIACGTEVDAGAYTSRAYIYICQTVAIVTRGVVGLVRVCKTRAVVALCSEVALVGIFAHNAVLLAVVAANAVALAVAGVIFGSIVAVGARIALAVKGGNTNFVEAPDLGHTLGSLLKEVPETLSGTITLVKLGALDAVVTSSSPRRWFRNTGAVEAAEAVHTLPWPWALCIVAEVDASANSTKAAVIDGPVLLVVASRVVVTGRVGKTTPLEAAGL